MTSPDLVNNLKSVLLELNGHPYPGIVNPPETPKRASVALILRIQPSYNHWPTVPEHTSHAPQLSDARPASPTSQRRPSSAASHAPAPHKRSFGEMVNDFFEQDWVKHGDPELLFIKRATRVGDKWNGHVALPGGKRDPEDADDQVTAMREALEEVGIDLSYANAICVGNLPQRVVTTSWGRVPLMVLCPYVYLLTSPSYPPQRIQPTEVASTHWVPLRALQSPALRTHEYADVSARLARSELGIKRWFLQAMLSKMMFAAIRLVPASSTYCATIPGFVPSAEAGPKSGVLGAIRKTISGPEGSEALKESPPLLLWGLTLGVVSDLLEHLPPHNALELWTYPTFTNWDVRFVMWAMSYRFRRQKSLEMGSVDDATITGTEQEAVGMSGLAEDCEKETEGYRPGEVGIAGLGVGRHWGRTGRAKVIARGAAVNSMLEGYYPLVRRAVATALLGRITVIALVATYLWRALRKGESVR